MRRFGPLVSLLVLVLASCANRGMMAPDDDGGPLGVAGNVGPGGASGGATSRGGTGGGVTGLGATGGAIGVAGTGGSAGVIGSAGTMGMAGRGGTTGTGGMSGTTGTGGMSGTTGGGGNAGALGRGGMSGTTGAGGMAGTGGGAAGTTGTGGTAGTTGTGGAAGTTGTGGAAGTTGTGGAAGTVGTGGAAGATGGTGGTGGGAGSAGRGGTGGTGGTANMCPLGGTLDCTTAGALTLSPGGAVTDFSAPEWNATAGRFCNANGLDGTIFQYAGTGSMSMVAVDTTARNLSLSFMVTASQYAGGGLIFDSCVNGTAFTAVQFTAAITTGSLTGCTLQAQVQTQEQRPATATNPSGGTCASNCYQYPAYQITTALSTTPMTITAPFPMFSPASTVSPTRTQIIGLQWQANSMSGTGTCSFELRVDDIRFVTQ